MLLSRGAKSQYRGSYFTPHICTPHQLHKHSLDQYCSDTDLWHCIWSHSRDVIRPVALKLCLGNLLEATTILNCLPICFLTFLLLVVSIPTSLMFFQQRKNSWPCFSRKQLYVTPRIGSEFPCQPASPHADDGPVLHRASCYILTPVHVSYSGEF